MCAVNPTDATAHHHGSGAQPDAPARRCFAARTEVNEAGVGRPGVRCGRRGDRPEIEPLRQARKDGPAAVVSSDRSDGADAGSARRLEGERARRCAVSGREHGPMPQEMRPGRTVVATVVGGIVGLGVGVVVGDVVVEPMMDVEGLATLLPVLWSAIVGIVVGAGVALVVAFRDEPARPRAVTAGTVVAVGLAMFVAAITDVVDVMVAHPITLAVVLPLVALLARRFVAGTTDP